MKTKIFLTIGCIALLNSTAIIAQWQVGGNDLNGLAEIMLDLAFADADWIRDRLTRLEGGETIRARQWMIDAVEHRISIQVSILTTGSGEEAKRLEDELIEHYRGGPGTSGLLNRR